MKGSRSVPEGVRPLILITGPKHSGKTCAGKALARFWEGRAKGPLRGTAVFVDLDELVESRTGKSPRLLYREGPDRFRKAEAEALRSLLEDSPPGTDGTGKDEVGKDGAGKDGAGGIVIAAAGGGLADNPEALEMLKQGRPAMMVYLEVPAEIAWERIRAAAERTGEMPPFLNTENPRETHRLIHERRGRIYRELAAIVVKAETTPEETAAAMLQEIESGGFFI
ncbi:MAG: shikimate kinase [Treponema sp.]|jgi:shikimate kinase|nr:shikimate kinase [Treponema sp.]